MRDWLAKLDDFLRLGGRDILQHAGKISHEQAVHKAELDFDAAVQELKEPRP